MRSEAAFVLNWKSDSHVEVNLIRCEGICNVLLYLNEAPLFLPLCITGRAASGMEMSKVCRNFKVNP